MTRPTTRKFAVGGAIVAAVGAISGGVAAAGGGDDDATDKAITGAALDKASAAALELTGEGTVSGTEVGEEDSYSEVEVTLDDGSQVDVQLDRSFNVVGSEGDRDGQGED